MFQISGATEPQYLTDNTQSLPRIANSVRLRDFEATKGINAHFPTPLLQFTVRMRPRDARALRLLLEQHAGI